jgi:hypothetical protein
MGYELVQLHNGPMWQFLLNSACTWPTCASTISHLLSTLEKCMCTRTPICKYLLLQLLCMCEWNEQCAYIHTGMAKLGILGLHGILCKWMVLTRTIWINMKTPRYYHIWKALVSKQEIKYKLFFVKWEQMRRKVSSVLSMMAHACNPNYVRGRDARFKTRQEVSKILSQKQMGHDSTHV